MTLSEWENAYKPLPATLRNSYWRHSIPDSALWELYHLSDFAVVCQTGTEVRLTPRVGPIPPPRFIHYPEDWQ